ncbi:MAG: acetyl-CoA carboxylase, biotin carboxyl carrier protein [Gammaproteobacteria bacterium RIFCSPLOWO2_02_FULL_61_13]|nr:MAG: acetyl-CoA carboxylase, biotin carboxyl carrier protein [Gammaproteobacteria bacterium RIFCSPLOWO2_02_FULL_61_13]
MDIRKVKKLIELLEESGISEIEIHEGEESVRVSRASAAPVAGVSLMAQAQGTVSTTAAETGAEQESPVEADGHVVRAPMVGLFYEAAAPGKPAFVTLGQTVRKGDVLCVIEAMKIMNQIEADVGGVIAKIQVENGDPVEYGQPLFVIREA